MTKITLHPVSPFVPKTFCYSKLIRRRYGGMIIDSSEFLEGSAKKSARSRYWHNHTLRKNCCGSMFLHSRSSVRNLLKTEKEDSDSEDEDLPGMSKIGPGDIGQRRTHNVSISNEVTSHRPHNHSVSDPDAIWQADEVAMQPIGEERCDPREQPDYEIKYQQSVTTEDVFLQMTGKTASTASCENMVVIIQLIQ